MESVHASFPSRSSSHLPPLSGISHPGRALWLRIEAKLAGDVTVGRIAYPHETGLAKDDAAVGPWPRPLGVAYYNDMMPTNRGGAYEDYGLTRNFEGVFRGA